MAKLHRSKDNKVVMGVIGGVADYINMDATILRVLAAVLILATGIFPGLIIYFIAGLLMPKAYTGRTTT